MKSQKKKSIFRQEVERDIKTFKRLPLPKKIRFVFDYFKWYILLVVTILVIIGIFASILYQGNRPYRLQVTASLNTDKDCMTWFHRFEKELTSDGKPYGIKVNTNQPFDYDDSYYYLHEVEVQTAVGYKRIDVAVCGPDMYKYLLFMNGCYNLDDALSKEDLDKLDSSGILVTSKANLKLNDDGSYDDSQAIEGHFAIDISKTEFGKKYNDDGENKDPLYAVLIVNTEHKEDGVSLLRNLSDLKPLK